jgi:hypothetical protein
MASISSCCINTGEYEKTNKGQWNLSLHDLETRRAECIGSNERNISLLCCEKSKRRKPC